MPVPKNLNYDAWLGSTPVVPYTENRVHPQNGYGRPGWLRCEQFGAGMITGWGAHHIDTAHWGMNTEHTGPIEVWGTAEFPASGLWNVHGNFKTEAVYANGVRMIVSGAFPNGIKFIGTEGWVFVSRGNETGHVERPGRAGVRPAVGGERSEDPRLRHRTGRDPLAREHRPPRQLARRREIAPAADRPRRGRPPRLLGLPAAPHRHARRSASCSGTRSANGSRTTMTRMRCCRGRSDGLM